MTERNSIVFLNRFYWPDVAATGQMLTDLAEDLAGMNWDVTVITSRTAYDAAGTELPQREARNGVRILRVSGTRFGRHRLAGRIADYGSYMVGALIRLLREPKPDVIVAMSDPPFALAIAYAAARLRRCRVIYWVQDLFPHIAAELGVMSGRGMAYQIAERLARRLHRTCDLVIALGPGMAKRLVDAGANPARTTYVHNWADAKAITPVPAADNPMLDELDVRGRFVVLYSGNAGRAHTFDAVRYAAVQLRDDPTIAFVFIGGGNRMAELQRFATENRLANTRFCGYVIRERLGHSLSIASASLVTEIPSVAGLLVPSKTYGILASGRALIFIGDPASDVARVVESAKCGVVLSTNDGQRLVDTIRHWRDEPAIPAAMGLRGRSALEQLYDRQIATAAWERAAGSLL